MEKNKKHPVYVKTQIYIGKDESGQVHTINPNHIKFLDK